MLIDNIINCTSSVRELSALRSDATSLKAFEHSVDKLAHIDVMITEFVATMEEMNKHDFCRMNLSAEDLESMKEAVKTCAVTVNNMTLSNNDVTAISTVFQSQKAILNTIWNSSAKEYVAPICSYLEIIQTFAENKEDIANLTRAMKANATAQPSASIVAALAANVQKANQITSDFQMGDSVRAFLQKARTGTATLVDITPDVSQWLTEHNLHKKIKLTF